MKIVLCLLTVSALALLSCASSAQIPENPWHGVTRILERIKPPVFPEKEFVITDFGAKGDSVTDCTEAFRNAIARCVKQGGGKIVVPEGIFLTGSIHLQSNVHLYISGGATIRFDRDPKKYLPVVLSRWEGVECMNYSPFLYAYGQENIAITGKGTLDGHASNEYWWPWKGKKEFGWKDGMPNQNIARDQLFEMGQQGVPVEKRLFGDGSCLRPSFIQPYRCKNILIEGITILNSPMWEIHPVLCTNVIVRDVTINTGGPNNDGCNPESCSDVLIENCSFNTGDDCIAIKSGRNNDGRRINVPSENIVIRNCHFKDGHGGVTIGSEISGGARNIFAEDCIMDSPILYSALRLKSNAVRGGTIENIFLRKIGVGYVDRAVFDVDLQYEEGEKGDFLPTIRNIVIDSMTVEKCNVAVNLVGYPRAPLRNILLSNCTFKNVSKGYTISNVEGMEIVRSTINGQEFTR